MDKVELKKNITKGICGAVGCFRFSSSKLCSTCRSKKSRLKNRMRYSWNTLRMHCRERKIPFMLPFKQFAKFCYETKYHLRSGLKGSSYTIDRINIDPTKGVWYYHISNIQKLTRSENVIKSWIEYDESKGGLRWVKTGSKRATEEDDYF